ncbi:LapA family protein [Paenibacillus sp. MABNR03]|uniref:LapA family protein n=1 Tax=Paenibacillus sp. MABNR03 TaxID=3142626 RepID=UPI003D280D12
MKMQWTLIAGLVFALLTGIFAVINVDSVQVNLLFNTVQIPLILLILGCTLIGGIIVGSYGIFRQYRLQRENKQLKLRISELENSTSTYSSPDSYTTTEPFVETEPDRIAQTDSIQSGRKGNSADTL